MGDTKASAALALARFFGPGADFATVQEMLGAGVKGADVCEESGTYRDALPPPRN